MPCSRCSMSAASNFSKSATGSPPSRTSPSRPSPTTSPSTPPPNQIRLPPLRLTHPPPQRVHSPPLPQRQTRITLLPRHHRRQLPPPLPLPEDPHLRKTRRHHKNQQQVPLTQKQQGNVPRYRQTRIKTRLHDELLLGQQSRKSLPHTFRKKRQQGRVHGLHLQTHGRPVLIFIH